MYIINPFKLFIGSALFNVTLNIRIIQVKVHIMCFNVKRGRSGASALSSDLLIFKLKRIAAAVKFFIVVTEICH